MFHLWELLLVPSINCCPWTPTLELYPLLCFSHWKVFSFLSWSFIPLKVPELVWVGFFPFSRYIPSIGAGGKRWVEEIIIIIWRLLFVRAKISFSGHIPLPFPKAGWGLLWCSSQVQGFQRNPQSLDNAMITPGQGSPADSLTRFCLSLLKVCSFPPWVLRNPSLRVQMTTKSISFPPEFQVA